MDEFSFIDSIKQHTYKQRTLIKGVGDDAAVFRQSEMDIVTAVDTFVEGVHFTRNTMEPFHVGYRALAANLSDMAAMGASAAFYLVSIVIPKAWKEDELKEIFLGMKELASLYDVDLIGGDTVSGKELSISITVIGYVEKGKVRYRNIAQADDIVFVTGTLGDSQAGFHILTNQTNYSETTYFINRHRMPSPRLAFADSLSSISRIALNDISDGIANEASEIAVASKVNIILDDIKIPTSTSYKQFPGDLQHKWKYYGGEDFELLGTVPKRDWQDVQKLADETNTKVTEIGYVSKDQDFGKVYLKKSSKIEQIQKKGYSHLK